MTTYVFKNNATSLLVGNITTAATSITVTTGDGALFPTLSAGQVFMITLEDRSLNPVVREICQCTAISGDTLTIVRAQEGTTAQAFNAGTTTVSNRLTAGVLTQIQAQTSTVTPLYIGAFSSAPTVAPGGTSLIPGMIYYNTSTNGLYEYQNTDAWALISANGVIGGNTLYCGAFVTAPSTRPDGSALETGDSYYNTTTDQLYVWSGSAWEVAANVNNIQGNVTINGNLTVADNLAVQGNANITGNTAMTGTLSVTGQVNTDNLNITGTLTLDGLPVVAADQLSGSLYQQDFPDGTMFQCGMTTTGSTVAFPTAFTTQVSGITATIIGDSSGDDPGCVISINSIDLNGFNVKAFRPTDGTVIVGRNCSWAAFGK
jgi:hypothetical protein